MARSNIQITNYIGSTCIQLRDLALEANQPLLAHLMEIAALEPSSSTRAP